MKQSFPGHFLMTPEKIEEMWKTATFVLDANVILSIYKYSTDSSARLIEIFKNLGDRVWIPHRVIAEVLENRFNVIGSQAKIYDETIKSLDNFESKLGKDTLHPVISSDLKATIQSKLTEVKEELQAGSTRHNNLYRTDENIKNIFEIFNGKIGEDFDNDTLLEIIEEGRKRYADKIPPGYADEKAKSCNASDSLHRKTNQYGDYIIWKQILNKFSESKQPVIFVTEDRKEDWWVLHPSYRKEVLFARPELVKEFHDRCEERLMLSSLDSFIEKLSENSESPSDMRLKEETVHIKNYDIGSIKYSDPCFYDINSRILSSDIAELNKSLNNFIQEKALYERLLEQKITTLHNLKEEYKDNYIRRRFFQNIYKTTSNKEVEGIKGTEGIEKIEELENLIDLTEGEIKILQSKLAKIQPQ